MPTGTTVNSGYVQLVTRLSKASEPKSPAGIYPVGLLTRFDSDKLYVHDHDALGFQVVIQRLGAVLAAEAALLDAAERQLVVAVM